MTLEAPDAATLDLPSPKYLRYDAPETVPVISSSHERKALLAPEMFTYASSTLRYEDSEESFDAVVTVPINCLLTIPERFAAEASDTVRVRFLT